MRSLESSGRRRNDSRDADRTAEQGAASGKGKFPFVGSTSQRGGHRGASLNLKAHSAPVHQCT